MLHHFFFNSVASKLLRLVTRITLPKVSWPSGYSIALVSRFSWVSLIAPQRSITCVLVLALPWLGIIEEHGQDRSKEYFKESLRNLSVNGKPKNYRNRNAILNIPRTSDPANKIYRIIPKGSSSL